MKIDKPSKLIPPTRKDISNEEIKELFFINSDLCVHHIGYECPECPNMLILDRDIIGFTFIGKKLGVGIAVTSKRYPAFVMECPRCFSKIAYHCREEKELYDYFREVGVEK